MEEILKVINPYVFLGCALVGYMIKHWVSNDFVNNKLIPTVVMIGGAIAYFTIYHSAEYIVIGAVVGLASTGSHQVITQLMTYVNERMMIKETKD